MQKKLSGYFFLSFFSFCLFTWVFHTVAHAQTSTHLQATSNTKNTPSPTIYIQQPKENKPAQMNKEISTLPTPTIYVAPPKTVITPTTTPVVVKELSNEVIASIPTPTPTIEITPTSAPLPTTPVVTDLESLFDKYSGEFGVDKELLKKIAQCESGFNTNSNNSGLYLGMYQFASQTWVSNRSRMGLDTNPDLRTNAEESIRTAAYVISRSGPGAWPNCH